VTQNALQYASNCKIKYHKRQDKSKQTRRRFAVYRKTEQCRTVFNVSFFDYFSKSFLMLFYIKLLRLEAIFGLEFTKT